MLVRCPAVWSCVKSLLVHHADLNTVPAHQYFHLLFHVVLLDTELSKRGVKLESGCFKSSSHKLAARQVKAAHNTLSYNLELCHFY